MKVSLEKLLFICVPHPRCLIGEAQPALGTRSTLLDPHLDPLIVKHLRETYRQLAGAQHHQVLSTTHLDLSPRTIQNTLR